jgi:hypothetical protein
VRQHPAERERSRVKIGAWGQPALLAESAESGDGDAGEGDLEAEGGELADVVGDLAAGGGLAFVVVRGEILVARAGAGQELW